MYKLQVTADKLSIRNTPQADPTYANWVGDMNKGEIFTAVNLIKGNAADGSEDFYADNSNRFASAQWLSQWWYEILRIKDLQGLARPYLNTNNPINIAVLDTGLIADDTIQKSFNIIGKRNFLTDTDDVTDNTNGHGTLCASLISANNLLFAGININANLFIGKIFPDSGPASGNVIVKAVDYLTDPQNNLNIDIISISGGVSQDDDSIALITTALSNAVTNSVIFSCAIGNYGETSFGYYPARDINALSIGALNEQSRFAGDVNPDTCRKIDFFLPGVSIKGLNYLSVKDTVDGTSQACAIMTGIISFVKAKIKAKNLLWKLGDFKSFLITCSDTFYQQIDSDSVLFYKINADKFINNFTSL